MSDINRVSIAKAESISYEHQNVGAALEQVLFQLGFDREHWGERSWNPFAGFIQKGDKVLLKPNLIRQSHMFNEDWEQVITHNTVIEAIVHYVYKALDCTGQIIIADGPQTDSDFDRIYQILQFERLKKHCKERYDYEIQICDLREEKWVERDSVITERISLPGDPLGYVEFDLREKSEFANHPCNRNYYGADYDFRETQKYHSHGHQRYRMCKTALDADVFINLPKLKTHKKAGVTLSLKNIVGVHGNRNYLPHHTMGTPDERGDEFENVELTNKLQSRLIRLFKMVLDKQGGKGGAVTRTLKKFGYKVFGATEEVIRSGNWYGNDTVWRMTLDLNKILFYGSPDGSFREKPSRRYLTIIDGFIGGEGNGPMAPDPKACGILVAGFNPVAVDCVCAHLMGFDMRKIPTLKRAFEIKYFPLIGFSPEEIEITSNDPRFNKSLFDIEKKNTFNFKPHFGWKGHIELE